MKKISTVVLQILIVLIGLTALGLLLWEPQLEGVNANATSLSDIYLDDPFLAFIYVGSIAFFVALYQAIKIMKYVGNNMFNSPATVSAFRNIKYCALIIIGFIVVAEIWIMLTHGDDDAAGAIAVGGMIILGSIIVALTAGMFERRLQKNL